MTLDHIELHSKFTKILHIYQSRIAPNISVSSGIQYDDHHQILIRMFIRYDLNLQLF